MSELKRIHYRLKKLTNRRTGYPLATWALYGPDADLATKLVVTVFLSDDAQGTMQKWVSDREVRSDAGILTEALGFIGQHGVRRVAMADRLIGCPHEQPADYDSEYCPDPGCAYWFGRDRWTGELERS